MKHAPKYARGPGSDYKPDRFAGSPHVIADGFYACVLCSKQLNGTEAAVRSHLRKHIRQKDLLQTQYLETVLKTMRETGTISDRI